MLLQYSFDTHHLEESSNCGNTPNTCIDFLRLRFPTYQADQITCGTLDSVDQLLGYDGLTSLDVEFVTNRIMEAPGVNLLVYCRDPALDQNLNSDSQNEKRSVDDLSCTSPNGDGPRDEPFNPPPVSNLLFQ